MLMSFTARTEADLTRRLNDLGLAMGKFQVCAKRNGHWLVVYSQSDAKAQKAPEKPKAEEKTQVEKPAVEAKNQNRMGSK